MSERRPISADAKPDFQALVNLVLPFAQQQLAKHGGFHPFGAAVNLQGEVSSQAADPGTDHPSPEEVLELLQAGFRQLAAIDSLRAAASCESVRITPNSGAPVDAIKITVEHHSGEAAVFYVPYRKRLLRGYRFDAMFAVPGMAVIFRGASEADAT